MRYTILTTWVLLAIRALGQSVITLTGTNTADVSGGGDYVTTGVTYADDSSTLSITATRSAFSTQSELASVVSDLNSTTTTGNSTSATSATSATQTLLVGSAQTSSVSNGTSSGNATATSSSAPPVNTVPCNGHRSFCSRSYSNITHIAAHNSPFVRPGNVASNQMLEVETQLNDGVRMLQFQTHLLNDTIYLCHTSCDIVNAGTLEDYLRTVVQWLRRNPYDVVTVLFGNSDVLSPDKYVAPVVDSGMIDYVYIPPTRPMPLDSWPTLGEMLLTNQRAVVMLDYEANQEEIPWLLDEFSQLWETPFSPTDRDFPCTAQRPPDRPRDIRLDRMYMANHNLNVQIALAGLTLDIPAYSRLNETNAVSGYGSAGAMVSNCTNDWGRPPNFLLVDYYNMGNFNGSVFQVAATANNVPYDRDSCCGTDQREFNAATPLQPSTAAIMAFVLAALALI